MNFNKNNTAIIKLLECAGPVLYDLKESLYEKLLKDVKTHRDIFYRLLYSAYDIYGLIDNRKARKLLSRLKVNVDTNEYRQLREKIK